MKKNHKIAKSVVYEGFGFPIILQNVPMVEVRGIWTPHLQWNKLEKIVLLLLAQQHYELTGYQIRFIRHCMQLNQRDFAKLFGVTHAAVVKWERSANTPVRMHLMTQTAIRLCVLDELLKDDSQFRDNYRSIRSIDFEHTCKSLEIDTSNYQIAV